MANIKEHKYDWVWNKQQAIGHLVAKYRPLQQTETIMVFGKGRINYYPIMVPRPLNRQEKNHKQGGTTLMKSKDYCQPLKTYTHWYPKNIINITNANHRRLHPTEKPIELLEYLIKTYTKENEIVLDMFGGSLSTAKACQNLNRQFIVIEQDKTFYEAGIERLRKGNK